LGALEVWHAGEPVPVTGPRQQRVLATLMCEAGRVVPVERLVDAIWPDSPPRTARRQVQNMVSALRQTPIGPLLTATGPGYLLAATDEQVDARQFERLVREARQAHLARDLAGAATRCEPASISGVGQRWPEWAAGSPRRPRPTSRNDGGRR